MKEELVLTFSNPQLVRQVDNTDRVVANAQLHNLQTNDISEELTFIAPIGLLEADELRWYLESYYIWPVGLFKQQPAIQIRRNIPNANPIKPVQNKDNKIRILAISPRPSQAGWFDHRASIKPLVEAIANLGDQFELTCIQPTFSALQQALIQAKIIGKPFHILHFDGHGVFDTIAGKGALCFEDELDNDKILPQATKLIYADELAQLLTEHHISLVFLEACQTAQSNTDPNASVAAALLQAGVPSVIAMTHSVLIDIFLKYNIIF